MSQVKGLDRPSPNRNFCPSPKDFGARGACRMPQGRHKGKACGDRRGLRTLVVDLHACQTLSRALWPGALAWHWLGALESPVLQTRLHHVGGVHLEGLLLARHRRGGDDDLGDALLAGQVDTSSASSTLLANGAQAARARVLRASAMRAISCRAASVKLKLQRPRAGTCLRVLTCTSGVLGLGQDRRPGRPPSSACVVAVTTGSTAHELGDHAKGVCRSCGQAPDAMQSSWSRRPRSGRQSRS